MKAIYVCETTIRGKVSVVQGPQGRYIFRNASGGSIPELIVSSDGKVRARFDDLPKHDKFNIWNYDKRNPTFAMRRGMRSFHTEELPNISP